MTAPFPASHRLARLAVLVALAASCGTSGPAARADHGRGTGTGTVAPAGPGRTAPGSVPAEVPVDPLPDPGVEPGACRLVTYTPAGAARAQKGELCRPAAAQRDVVVIVVHGGAGIAGTYAGLRPWAERYGREGYVTFLPDYHLFAPGSRERPVFPRPEQHIKAAVQYVRGVAGALGVRPDRVVVQGQSAGARLGAVAFTTPDDPWFDGPELHPGISCAVDAFIGFYHPYDGTMQYADQYYGGRSDLRERGNSLRRAGAAQGPALFLTGSRDWDLITDQQQAFATALRAAGRPARAVVIEGGGHGFDEGDGVRLSRRGEEAATETLRFLADAFPSG